MTMTQPSTHSFPETPGTELVARSIAGDAEAFTEIVREHQSLICSMAYSATGSIRGSEDISQEVFVTAWSRLKELRDPGKLRHWLSGIARNLISNARRKTFRDRATVGVDALQTVADPQPGPVAQAVTREEQALLWRSLAGIPDVYREPLIMFYRQQHSIAHIAESLDITEEAVKQRLSRGRKLLQAEMEAFVESALQRSAPGPAFTVAVVTALPGLATSTAGAALGAGGGKSAAAGMLKIAGLIASPLLILIGFFAGYRMGLEQAGSDGERAFIKGFYRRLMVMIAGFFAAFVLLCIFGKGLLTAYPTLFAAAVISILAIYLLATMGLTLWGVHVRRSLRAAQVAAGAPLAPEPAHEYRGPFNLLGLPFIHMRMNSSMTQGPTTGWIAIGDNARGILFGFGGSATGIVAVGGSAIGVFALGGLSIGLFSLGGFALGMYALGGLAAGFQAFGGCAIAWNAACGGIAVSHLAALGQLAQAPYANNAAAQNFIDRLWSFRTAQLFQRYALFMNLLWVVPLLLFWRGSRKHLKK